MSLDAGALYLEYHRMIHGYIAKRMQGVDDAVIDDLAADVWERVVRKAPAYRERNASPKPWLFRIAHNLLVDRYRERSRRATVLRLGEIRPYVEHVGTADHVASISARQDVARTLPRLTGPQQAVVRARYFGRCSTQEASDETGHSLDAVKKLQLRALVQLRKMLEAA